MRFILVGSSFLPCCRGNNPDNSFEVKSRVMFDHKLSKQFVETPLGIRKVFSYLLLQTIQLSWTSFFLFLSSMQVIGLLQGRSHLYTVALSARPNVTAFAFLSSSVNPVLYVFAGSSHIRRAGLSFMAKLLEGTYSEHSSTSGRRSTIHTSSSALGRMSVKSLQAGGMTRNKSFAGEEGKGAETSCMEEAKNLTTMQWCYRVTVICDIRNLICMNKLILLKFQTPVIEAFRCLFDVQLFITHFTVL